MNHSLRSETAFKLTVEERLDLLRRQLLKSDFSEFGFDMPPYDDFEALVTSWPGTRPDSILQPIVKELCEGLPLYRDGQAFRVVGADLKELL